MAEMRKKSSLGTQRKDNGKDTNAITNSTLRSSSYHKKLKGHFT